MKKLINYIIVTSLIATLSSCGSMGAVHYDVHTKWRGTYSIQCDSEELSGQLDEAFDFIGSYIGDTDIDDSIGTTITLHGETRGRYEMKRNGETVIEGQWESVSDSEIELMVDGERLILEVERIAGKIHIIANAAVETLCQSEEGSFEGKSHHEGDLNFE